MLRSRFAIDKILTTFPFHFLGTRLNPALTIIFSFAAVICLTPLAFYLAWIASINKRSRPTIVSGTWDIVRTFAGLYGFLFIGGILLLNLVQSDTRFLARGNFEQLRAGWAEQKLAWLAVSLGYILLIVAGVALAISSRKNSWSVYNVDSDDLDSAVESALTRAGLEAKRTGNSWKTGQPVMEVKPFHGMQFAMVRFLYTDVRVREELERQLRSILNETPSPENPAAGWLTSIATGLVIVIIGILALTSYIIFFK